MTSFRRFGLLILMTIVVGCDSKPRANYSNLKLVNATGTIRLDGAPLAAAVVSFDDPTDGTYSYGLTNSSGQYRLQIDSDMTGVKPGAKVVRISTKRRILGLNMQEEGATSDDQPAAASELVPEKFNKKSTLVIEVTAGQSVYDFDLKSE